MNDITPIKILGVPVHPYTMKGAVEKILELVSKKKKNTMIFA